MEAHEQSWSRELSCNKLTVYMCLCVCICVLGVGVCWGGGRCVCDILSSLLANCFFPQHLVHALVTTIATSAFRRSVVCICSYGA